MITSFPVRHNGAIMFFSHTDASIWQISRDKYMANIERCTQKSTCNVGLKNTTKYCHTTTVFTQKHLLNWVTKWRRDEKRLKSTTNSTAMCATAEMSKATVKHKHGLESANITIWYRHNYYHYQQAKAHHVPAGTLLDRHTDTATAELVQHYQHCQECHSVHLHHLTEMHTQ